MTTITKDNKVIIKDGNRIIGFVYPVSDHWAYAYGSPSQQGGYIGFEINSKDKAIECVKKFHDIKFI